MSGYGSTFFSVLTSKIYGNLHIYNLVMLLYSESRLINLFHFNIECWFTQTISPYHFRIKNNLICLLHIFTDDTPMTEETVLSMSSSLVGLTPGKNDYLMHLYFQGTISFHNFHVPSLLLYMCMTLRFLSVHA